MRVLLLFDSSRVDNIFEGIAKEWIESDHEIDIYDVSYEDKKGEYHSTKVHPFSAITEAVIEYYEVAICSCETAALLRDYDIYVFAYKLNNKEKAVANPGADFIFISEGECVYDCAYATVGTLDENNLAKTAQEIMNAVSSLNSKMIRNMEYPCYKRYELAELKETVVCDESITLENLKRARLLNIIRSINQIEKWCPENITNDYLSILNKLVFSSNEKQRNIIKFEKLIAYTFFSEHRDEIIKYVEDDNSAHEAVCKMLLSNTLYQEARDFLEQVKYDNVLYAFVMSTCTFFEGDNKESIWWCNQYFNNLENAKKAGGFGDAESILAMAKTKCISQLKQNEEIETKTLIECLQSASRVKQGEFYYEILKESELLARQGKRKEALKGEALYCSLQKEVDEDSRIYGHKYLVYINKSLHNKILSHLSKNKMKRIGYTFVSIFYRCISLFGEVLATRKGAQLSKKAQAFTTRCLKFVKRKLKEILIPLRIYGRNERKILRFKNKYKGRRCFILGNGPSLRIEDLNKLHENGDICFACNKIYKVFDHTEWRPTFYACIDSAVFRQNYYSILNRGDFQKFFGANLPFQDEIKKNKQNILVNYATKDIEKTKFNPNATFIYSGGTVTFVLITLAWLMGFREIYLIGCDHSYGFFGASNSGAVESTSDTNNDYFIKNYMRPGEVLNVGNLDRSHEGYSIARRYIESHGGKIYNATRGGKLEVFERRDLDEVLNAVNK